MRIIWKYELLKAGVTTLHVPLGAKLLSIQWQRGEVKAWFEVDIHTRHEEVKFMLVGPGDAVPDGWTYSGFALQEQAEWAWHVYRK